MKDNFDLYNWKQGKNPTDSSKGEFDLYENVKAWVILSAIVRSFPGDGYIMGMALKYSGVSDLNKLGFLQLLNSWCSAVTHSCS